MKAQELLNKHPLTAKVIKDWWLEKLMESMKENSIPEEFKESSPATFILLPLSSIM